MAAIRKPETAAVTISRTSRYSFQTSKTVLRISHGCRRNYASKPSPYATSSPSNDPHSFPNSFRIYHDITPLRAYRRKLASQTQTVGLVPTMGALHDGHLSLIRAAANDHPHVFVSIFVNPTQFGPKEDLSTYPRTWDEDLLKLERLNKEVGLPNSLGKISAIFNPSVKTMYPTLPPTGAEDGHGSFISITPLAQKLEGGSRPTFFRGVATVCTKLFNIVQPDAVYFGQKDVQQSVLIRRMVKDFHIPTTVQVLPTSRESDGLAMSSRNVYLGQRRRSVAVVLSRALANAEKAYGSGNSSAQQILVAAKGTLQQELSEQRRLSPSERALFEVDYVALTDLEEMDEISKEASPDRGAVLSLAVKMLPVEEPINEDERNQKPVRLIDNTILAPRLAG